jgi:peptidoglycan/xylan/chitin deacetylase (PgdA/CDA1 family)
MLHCTMQNVKLTGFKFLVILAGVSGTFFSCNGKSSANKKEGANTVTKETTVKETLNDNNTDLPKTTASSAMPTGGIPILCYHQIRDWKSTDSKFARTYIVPVDAFKSQMKMLHDSGFHTILPDQYLAYLEKGEPLPSRPVMLTFDDGPESQVTNALAELDKEGFKAVFFIMTVVLGHPNFVTKQDVRDIDSKGHVIGCHTWNHTSVTKYKEKDWAIQVEKPKKDLEKIIGKPVNYFAYPNGLWNAAAAAEIKKYGYIAAFKLWEKMDKALPLYTIKRRIASGYWDNKALMNAIRSVEMEKAERGGK